ncbi:hypothetical protein Calab_0411 [Caldithrix abyssi DSM 13497]|uniref:Uracil-DNA glycosylase n=1 Tax=Caldithrix abyssi DSM 13497 TaxID=880073 RepID=H1XQG9_CALAY|nr:uracil-DNA glycosylase family protein [Caldithrix abyssi]APF19967.1 Uracil-DNA glycosylase [Caldithrix abyssi DSM 13497]EHO40056.1 hypothetical protein Calab_0411 [Caldithrix abyssi DSM 13497]
MRLPADWEKLLTPVLDVRAFYNELERFIKQFSQIIPEKEKIFSVFHRVPPHRVCCVLYGEDPYPRLTSANGVAFWDEEIRSWDDRTAGNSMKNILKALLVARGLATYHTPIAQCREIARAHGLKSPADLFERWLQNGALLVNVALTFSSNKDKKQHFLFWHEFHQALIQSFASLPEQPYFILWGKKAQNLESRILKALNQPERIIKSGHPTFIHQFLNAEQPAYSPFKEIEQKTGFSWL